MADLLQQPLLDTNLKEAAIHAEAASHMLLKLPAPACLHEPPNHPQR